MTTQCSATLSANAGISVTFTRGTLRRRVWIDAAHRGKITGFSTIYDDLWNRIKANENFTSPDALVFTHCHGDHYSRRMAEEALRLWPKAHILLPEDRVSSEYADSRILISGPRVVVLESSAEDLRIDMVRLPHEGARFAHVPHYGIFLTFGGVTVFASGDCELASKELLPCLEGRRIDLAILAFPWVTLQRGRKYVEEHIKPSHILACHLPFEQDDVYGYRKACTFSASMLPGIDVRPMDNALQTERYIFQR